MRKWQAIPVAGAAALLVAVTMTLPALLGTHSAFAGLTHNGTDFPSMQMEVDCDTGTPGVQNTCNILTTSVAAIPIDVYISNFSGATSQIDGFNYTLYNDQCMTGCVNGNTTNAAGGIGPSVPVPDATNVSPANFSCAAPPPSADTGTSAPGAGASTSFLSCSLLATNSTIVANGASSRISGESFSDSVIGATTIVLTLSQVASADDNGVPTITCDPAAPPPASPEGAVTGPCFPATLCFGSCQGVATATVTASPVPPTVTPTPCVSNCPPTATPTPLGFVTITPNAATLTATAPTAAPPTAAPPPPGGEQPGDGGPPVGNVPGGGAGAGGSGPITLPDTGAGKDGGIDWTAASLLALVAIGIGGAAGGMYLGAAHVAASRRERGDD